METDYRISNQDLGVSGSYFGVNKTFGGLINFMPSDDRVQSGKINTLTLIYSGSSFSGSVDFLFLNASASSVGLVQGGIDGGSQFTMSFADTKNILSNVRINTTSSEGPNYAKIGSHSVTSVRNLNIPFNCDSLYLVSAFQATNASTSSFASGSVWVSVGYELGQSHP